MDKETFKQQFDEDGYVILKNFILLELMENAKTAINRMVDKLAEEQFAAGKIPHPFKDEPF